LAQAEPTRLTAQLLLVGIWLWVWVGITKLLLDGIWLWVWVGITKLGVCGRLMRED
jgi:hypothetical protein